MQERNKRIFILEHPNTWSNKWNCQGIGHTIWSEYKPTEAFVILDYAVIKKQLPVNSNPSFIQQIWQLVNNFFAKKN